MHLLSSFLLTPFKAALTALLLWASLALPHLAFAEQLATFGPYQVHYNAFNSRFIPPEVAQVNGLIRSKNIGYINVSVLKTSDDASPVAITAKVSGTAKDLAGRSQTLSFKTIDEGEAIYYLGQFGFTNNTQLRFTLLVQPDANQPADVITFEQTFFLD